MNIYKGKSKCDVVKVCEDCGKWYNAGDRRRKSGIHICGEVPPEEGKGLSNEKWESYKCGPLVLRQNTWNIRFERNKFDLLVGLLLC